MISAAGFSALQWAPGGVTDNTALINTAIADCAASGGGSIEAAPGVYAIGALKMLPGVVLWSNTPYAVRLVAMAPLQDNMVNFTGPSGAPAHGAGLIGITLDMNGQPGDTCKDAMGNALHFSPISMAGCNDAILRDLRVLGWTQFGAGIGNSLRNKVERCYFERLGGASPQQNQAISASGLNVRLLIAYCDLINSGLDICAQDSDFIYNYVTGHGFGAGITTEADARCFSLRIMHNTLTNSAKWIDSNNTRLLGIENWAASTDISHNKASFCFGDGIDNGGPNCIVESNRAWNNGSVPGSAGLGGRGGCDGTVYSSNRCWDDRAATARTQSYGLILQPGVGPVVVGGDNNFAGNVLGPALYNGAKVTVG